MQQQKPAAAAGYPALNSSLTHPAAGYLDTQHYNTPAYSYGIDYFSSKFEKYPSLMTPHSMTSANYPASNSMNMHNVMSSHMAGLNGMSSQLSNYGHHQGYTSQHAANDATPDYKDTGSWSKFHAL